MTAQISDYLPLFAYILHYLWFFRLAMVAQKKTGCILAWHGVGRAGHECPGPP